MGALRKSEDDKKRGKTGVPEPYQELKENRKGKPVTRNQGAYNGGVPLVFTSSQRGEKTKRSGRGFQLSFRGFMAG